MIKFIKQIIYLLLSAVVIQILLLQNINIVTTFAINLNSVDGKTIISLLFIYILSFITSLCIYLLYVGIYRKKRELVILSILIVVATSLIIFILIIFMPFISWSMWGFAP